MPAMTFDKLQDAHLFVRIAAVAAAAAAVAAFAQP